MKKYLIIMVFMLVSLGNIHAGTLLGTDFTYQGELKDEFDSPLTGTYDFKFVAFDTKDDGTGTIQVQVVVEDVLVTNGIFTTTIDFGSITFVGEKVWMEINVRVGTSVGGYTQLLPRQEITSTPYAIHAQFVGADAVTGIEIFNGSIGSDDLGANSVTINSVADNAIGSNEIISSEVQQRLIGNCTAGSFVSSVNENGTVNCSVNTVLAALVSTLESKVTDLESKDLTGKRCPIGQYISGFDSEGEPICGLISVSRYNIMLCGNVNNDFDDLLLEIGFSAPSSSCSPNSTVQAMLITRTGDISATVAVVQSYINSGGIVITEYENADEIFNYIFGTAVVRGLRYGTCRDNINPQVQFNPTDSFWNNFDFTPQNLVETGCGHTVDAFPGITALGGWSFAGSVSLAYRNSGLGRLWLVASDWQDNSVDFDDNSKDMLKYMILHRD